MGVMQLSALPVLQVVKERPRKVTYTKETAKESSLASEPVILILTWER